MKRYHWLLIGLAASLPFGCSQKAEREPAADAASRPAAAPMAAAPSAAPADEPAEQVPDQSGALAKAAADTVSGPARAPSAAASAGRLLVYHAEVRLKTAALPRAAARLDSLLRRSGGYVSAATETRENGEWRQETTIRVPPARFQALLGGLGGLGTVEEKKLSTADVTAEHADVAARLTTKRAVERQYTALLGRAQRIKDVLDVEEKLGEVREEIEATESRLKTLNSEVAYSTITLTLYQPLAQAVPDAPVVSLVSRLVAAVYDGWQLLVSLLLGLLGVWPLLLLGAAGGWLWLRRRRRATPPPPPAPAA